MNNLRALFLQKIYNEQFKSIIFARGYNWNVKALFLQEDYIEQYECFISARGY